MSQDNSNKFSLHIKSNIFLGLFILIPLLLTAYFAYYIFILLAAITYPLIQELPFHVYTNKYVLYIISFLLSMTIIYIIGVVAKMWLGRVMLDFINYTVKNIPVVGTFYKSLKQLADTFNNQDKSLQKVVLINFPSDDMKTIGFIIKTFKDSNTGQELASVYVPTTPNPTSGYLEIVPLDKTIPLDWTFEESMSFIISGGSNMPNKELSFVGKKIN